MLDVPLLGLQSAVSEREAEFFQECATSLHCLGRVLKITSHFCKPWAGDSKLPFSEQISIYLND